MNEEFNLPAVWTGVMYGHENDEPLEATLDRLITPNFVQRSNGRVYKRSECTAHVREMRQLVVGGGVVPNGPEGVAEALTKSPELVR